MEQPNGEPQKIALANLGKEYYRLQFLVDEGNDHLKREMEVSVKAGELVGVIYDKLLEQYGVVESRKPYYGRHPPQPQYPLCAVGLLPPRGHYPRTCTKTAF